MRDCRPQKRGLGRSYRKPHVWKQACADIGVMFGLEPGGQAHQTRKVERILDEEVGEEQVSTVGDKEEIRRPVDPIVSDARAAPPYELIAASERQTVLQVNVVSINRERTFLRKGVSRRAVI